MRNVLKPLIAAIFAVSLAAYGCAHKRFYEDATDAFNSGDYDNAVYKSAKALKSKPDYPEAITLLKNAAPIAHERHLKKASGLEEKENFDAAVAEYQTIDRLIYAVASVRQDIDLEDVSDRKNAAALKAAEAHYGIGLSLLREGEKASDAARLKQASAEFRAAGGYVKGYKDTDALYERARKGAVVRVAVLTFRGGGFSNYGDMIADQVVAYAMKRAPEFLEFVTRDHLSEIEGEKEIHQMGVVDSKMAIEMGKVLGVQHIITGRVLTATVDTPKRTDARGSAACNVAKRKEPERIKAVSWTTHEQRSSAMVNASFQIIDVKTGRIIAADSIKTDVVDLAKWMEFSGEEECLPWEVRHFSNGKTSVDNGKVLLAGAVDKASGEIAVRLTERFK